MWILYVVTFSSSFYLSIPFILMQILSFVGGELGNKNWREREREREREDEEEKEKLISISRRRRKGEIDFYCPFSIFWWNSLSVPIFN